MIVDSSDIPSSFTIPSGNDDLFNISMKGQNDFVDIQYRKLTYAEAASLSKDKSQTNLNSKFNLYKEKRTSVNQFNALACDDELEEPDLEKSDAHYQKSSKFKSKQKDLLAMKKIRNAERKMLYKEEVEAKEQAQAQKHARKRALRTRAKAKS